LLIVAVVITRNSILNKIKKQKKITEYYVITSKDKASAFQDLFKEVAGATGMPSDIAIPFL